MAINLPPDQRGTVEIASMTPREILERGIEIQRLETIPLSAILTERSLIDTQHALDLGASMKKKRGQIIPIAARARLSTEGDVVYDVIDGFHRVEGKKVSGDKTIDGNVLYGCDDDEMNDLRILAVSSVKSVQFPRVAQWINDSWDVTDYAKKGLSAAQAFAIAVNDSQRSNLVSLSGTELDDIKGWAQEKCDRWGKSLTAVYGILRVVSNADPDLVRQVRTSGGGKDRTGKITPIRLGAVVNAFPGKDNFPAQRAALQVAVESRFTAEETKALVEYLKPLIEPGMTEEQIIGLSADFIIAQAEKASEPKPQRPAQNGALKPDTATAVAVNLDNTGFDDDVELEFGLSDDEFEPPEDELAEIEADLHGVAPRLVVSQPVRKTPHGNIPGSDRPDLKQINVHALAQGDENAGVAELREKIRDLERALEEAHNGRGASDYWWRTAPFLTPVERLCAERIMFENQHYEAVAGELGDTPLNVFAHLRSAYVKKHLMEAKHLPAGTADRIR